MEKGIKMNLTREFLNNKDKNVWTFEEIINSYSSEFPQLNAFKNISEDILKSIKITTEMIRDINHWHGLRLVDVMVDMLEIYPSDYKIKTLLYEDKLYFYLVDDERRRYIDLSIPTKKQEWLSFEDNELLEKVLK